MTTRDGNTFELKAQGWQNFSSTTAAGESENKKARRTDEQRFRRCFTGNRGAE